MTKLTIGMTFIVFAVINLTLQVGMEIKANYEYEKEYSQYWQLADKSSTIEAKQKYINLFMSALTNGYNRGDFADNDAIVLKTSNNSFKSNLEALQTLSGRLNDIQKMNPASFEYNTAIQQITAQEQGEASKMLSIFDSCWTLNNYALLWGWFAITWIVLTLVLLCVGVILVICVLGYY